MHARRSRRSCLAMSVGLAEAAFVLVGCGSRSTLLSTAFAMGDGTPADAAGVDDGGGEAGVDAFVPAVDATPSEPDAPADAAPPDAVAPDPLSDCLVAYYPFDGDARDRGPNHLDGTLNGRVQVGPPACGVGQAYVLDGVSSYVSLGSSVLLKPSRGVSVAVWLRADTFAPTYQNVVSDHAPNETTVGYAYILRLKSSVLQFLLGGAYGLGQATTASFDLGFAVPGVWRHVAAVYDGALMRLYVDGILEDSAGFDQPLGQNDNPMLVGKSGFGEFLEGSIAGLRIYGCALDEGQIAALFAPGQCR